MPAGEVFDPVLEKACGPRLIGAMAPGGGMAVDTGGCGVGFSLPRDNDGAMEGVDRLLLADGSATCSSRFPRAYVAAARTFGSLSSC